MRLMLLAAVSLSACGLAACQQMTLQEQARSHAEPDPMVLMIETGRHGVLIDRALEGVREHAQGDDQQLAENENLRADRAVKDGAVALIGLRNEICGRGLLKGADCNISLPSWASEPPTDRTSLKVIQQRSDWLDTAMSKFVELGCEAGRKATDYQFCSVE
jgi:hypothetical protein